MEWQTRILQACAFSSVRVQIPFSRQLKNPTEIQWDFLNYRPDSLKASDKCAKSEIDEPPRIEGFISAISKACSSLASHFFRFTKMILLNYSTMSYDDGQSSIATRKRKSSSLTSTNGCSRHTFKIAESTFGLGTKTVLRDNKCHFSGHIILHSN